MSVILSIETITYVLDNYRSIKQYDSDGNYIAEKYKLDSPYFSFTQADDDCLWLFDSNINGKAIISSIINLKQTVLMVSVNPIQ